MGCEPIIPIWADVFENDYKYNDLLIVVTIACLTQLHYLEGITWQAWSS